MRNISFLSSSVGRSTKKISSKRPLRRNSGGSWLISFAVATTKTGLVFSCIHVRIVENTLEFVPPSLSPPTFKPFSISSIHRTHGATASAVAIARRMLFSLLPTSAWKTLPTSSLKRGCFHSVATHFAVKLLPHPGTPSNIMPFGSWSPNSFAFLSKALLLCFNQALRLSRPPTFFFISRFT